MMENKQKSQQKKHVAIRIVVCLVILMIGWLGMNGLASLKKPPAEAKTEERALKVQVQTVQPADYPIVITGYGEARALTVVAVAPEQMDAALAFYNNNPAVVSGDEIRVGVVGCGGRGSGAAHNCVASSASALKASATCGSCLWPSISMKKT